MARVSPAPRLSWRAFLWRGIAFCVVFLAGLTGLLLGVGVSERPLDGAGLGAQAYYVLGLFVLGGLDIGTPVGGPALGRFALWFAYFAAPVITASALIEAAIRLVHPLALRARTLKGHVVLGGAGRLTMVYVKKLREQGSNRTIVVVEQNARHPNLSELRDAYRAVVVPGDITHDAVLAGLALERAHRVLLLTSDDFSNLDAASKALRFAPNLEGRMVVHVSDLGFLRETKGSRVSRDCEIFNGHEFAAMRLVEDHLLGRFRDTPGQDIVVLAGFGRFGQTVLRQLQEHASSGFSHVVILDERATENVRAFEEHPGFLNDYRRSVLDGDLLDPDVWARIGGVIDAEGTEPVIVLGCGDDGTNLQAALMVRKRYPDAYAIVRSFRQSPFTEEVAREAGAHAFHLGGLIERGMPESWL